MKRRILSQHAPFAGARYVAACTNLRGWVVLDTASNRTLVGAGTLERAMEMARELSNQELEEHPLAMPRPKARHVWIRRILDGLLRRSEGRRVVAEPPRTAPSRTATTKAGPPTVEPALPRAPDLRIAPAESMAVGGPTRKTNHPGSESTSRQPSARRRSRAEARGAQALVAASRRATEARSAPPPVPALILLSPKLANGIRSSRPSIRREARIRLLEACLPAGATWHSEATTAGFRVWVEDGTGQRLSEVKRKSLDAALLRLVQDTK